jgi:hypothetical protein
MRFLSLVPRLSPSSVLYRIRRHYATAAAEHPVISVYIDMKSPHSYLALQVRTLPSPRFPS